MKLAEFDALAVGNAIAIDTFAGRRRHRDQQNGKKNARKGDHKKTPMCGKYTVAQ